MPGVIEAERREGIWKGCGQAWPEELRGPSPSVHPPMKELTGCGLLCRLYPRAQTISATWGFFCCPHANDSQIYLFSPGPLVAFRSYPASSPRLLSHRHTWLMVSQGPFLPQVPVFPQGSRRSVQCLCPIAKSRHPAASLMFLPFLLSVSNNSPYLINVCLQQRRKYVDPPISPISTIILFQTTVIELLHYCSSPLNSHSHSMVPFFAKE